MNRFSVKQLLLTAFSLVALLPLIVFFLAFWFVLTKHLETDIGETSKSAVISVSQQVSAIVSTEPLRMLPAVLLIAGNSNDEDFLKSVLRAAKTPRPELVQLAILNSDNRVLCSFPDDKNASGSLYQMRAVTTHGLISISKPFRIDSDDRKYIEVAFSANGRSIAALIDLTAISSKMVLSLLSPSDRIGVIDEDGRYVLCSEPSRVLRDELLPPAAMLNGPTPMRLDDGDYYASSFPVPGTGWRTVYLRSTDEAQAPLYKYRALIIPLCALGVMLAVFAALVGQIILTRPLQSLLGRIKLIAEGRYAERVSLEVPKEYRPIAEAFNAMAESIEHRDREIQRSEERYRLLFHGNRVPALLIDESSGLVKDANPAAVRYYGYGTDELRTLRIDSIDELPLPEFLREMRTAVEIPSTRLIGRHRLKDGQTRDVELYASRMEFESDTYLHVVVFDVTERRVAEERMALALREKTQLIQEIYHRVKNNQQLVVSLLRMQNDYAESEETRRELKTAQDRMFAMSLIHDLVYQMEDLSMVDIALFIERLVQNFSFSYGNRIRPVELDIAPISLEMERAIPFALALNELLASAMIDESDTGSLGGVRVSLRVAETPPGKKEAVATVIDEAQTGDAQRYSEKKTLSVLLVGALAGQIKGEAIWFRQADNGECRAELRFPI